MGAIARVPQGPFRACSSSGKGLVPDLTHFVQIGPDALAIELDVPVSVDVEDVRDADHAELLGHVGADLAVLPNGKRSASSGQVQLDREEWILVRRVVVGDHHAAVGQDAEAGEIEADVVARA